MQPSMLKLSVVSALGFAAIATSSMASAGVMYANWTGYHYLLDPNGAVLANTSLSYKSNQYVTPISGTLQLDDVTGAGTATMAPFDWGSNQLGNPMEFSGINLQFIGDGMGGPGTLMHANMLFSWNTSTGIPVSVVLDAAGFLAGELSAGGANSATPATDGTYIGGASGGYLDAYGYLAQGKMPIVTTAWNTSLGPNCAVGNCMNNGSSGILPLVFDTATNTAYDGPNTGGSIGGSPMADGPFPGYNVNFNIGAISVTSYDPNAWISPCSYYAYSPPADGHNPCVVVDPQVPIPAAAWLFGSGLLSVLGFIRRKS